MEVIERLPLLARALDAMPNMVVILNSHRQIVAANRAFLKILNTSISEVVEKRPGEAIGCIRAKEGPDGCGTALHCATCGAVRAILDSMQATEQTVRECRILSVSPSGIVPLDLRVIAAPFNVEQEVFTIVTVEDISNEKRAEVLQRTFFHDVLNTAGCIQGYTRCLASKSSSDDEVCRRLIDLGGQLIEEIESHRDLLHAESGELKPHCEPLRLPQILKGLCNQYHKHPAAKDRNIVIGQLWDGTIRTDRRLFLGVLGHMMKNALEATSPGGTVTLSCIDGGESVVFTVNNPEVMTEEVQLQVFHRYFSTKEQAGRGIGTYSMKLLGERYLGGKVDFVSRSGEGTTFRMELPKQPLPNRTERRSSATSPGCDGSAPKLVRIE